MHIACLGLLARVVCSQAALISFDVFLGKLGLALRVDKADLFGRLLSGLLVPVVKLLSLADCLWSYAAALLLVARGIYVADSSGVYIVSSFVSDLARSTPFPHILMVRKLTYSVLT